ncbi:xylose isomerase-like protein [Stachybotrys elegans]|uniref:Xylose isomerase-like protein n=1 Tax=Stachybotrys elegans TaxID=80388 RepID=A0A8K0WQD4_9HYPO|nr:xylose isomerase-like protein [Stachybotrys elegans]
MIRAPDSTLIPTSFATCSFVNASGEALPEKLKAIKNAGFDGIELAMPDLLEYGGVVTGGEVSPTDYQAIAQVAKKVRQMTDELGLTILMLQPFANFEGWTVGTFDKERRDAFDRVRGWMLVMESAGIEMLQIGSSDAEGISVSVEALARDLCELCSMFEAKGFRIAYENWCWATRAPTWKDVWSIVKQVNRPQIGLCLDTFQTAGSELADPTTKSGYIGDREDLAARWVKSLTELTASVPPEKIFLLQISDAYKMDPPLENSVKGGQRPRSRWSHDYRPLPGGGYLAKPVQQVLDAVLSTGFRGWLSIETFDSKMKDGISMEDFAKQAMESLEQMVRSSLA